ncbi:MAG: LacI family DNA-binding transcriptional regulator [Pseudomonadota bacterium]
MTKTVKVTLAEVAAKAGVSKMTASRAFAQPGAVRAETRERVLAAAKRLGYVPDLIASAFSTKTTKVLGVVIPTLDVSTFSDTVRGISDASAKAGYDILIGQTKYDDETEDRVIQAFVGRRVDGLLMVASERQADMKAFFRERDLPVVQLWDIPKQPIDMVSGFLNRDAGKLAAKHVHAQGYSSAAVYHTDLYRDRQQADGFVWQAKKLGLAQVEKVLMPSLETHGRVSEFSAGHLVCKDILGRTNRPRAIYCTDDSMAFSTYFELIEAGLRVPEHIALCGFNNAEYGQYMRPQLTTIDVDGYAMGTKATEMILTRLSGEPPHSGTHKTQLKLICGQTT